MEGLNLQLLLKENKNILLDFLKNEFMHIVKDSIVEDIKIDIHKLLFSDNIYKKDKSKKCGFRRSRKRGSCKRLTNYLICPYHLEKARKEYENISLPDKNSSGMTILPVNNQDKENKNLSKDHKIDINKPYYKEYINYLNNVYYGYDEIIYKSSLFDEETKIFGKIDTDIFNYDIIISTKENDNKSINLIGDNINLNNKKKKKKNKKRNKNKPKTLEKKFDIFNDKIKNFIRSYMLLKEDKEIIVETINIYLLKYKNNEINLSSCGYHIFDDTYDYIYKNKHKYDNQNIIVNLHKKVIIYYKMFSVHIDEKDDKWLSKIDEFMENTLKEF